MRLLQGDTLKFGLLVGLAAILIDAVIAHGIFWENDPYWTYWITKTFLITTVFTIGTALFGIGIKQGLGITLVHTLILEIYYDVLTPIGLPQEPMWLPFHDLWIPGYFIHYLTILAGYLIALWLWRRHQVARLAAEDNTSGWVLKALGLTALILLVDLIITQLLILKSFPGITLLIQRLLITFVFISLWQTFIGYVRRADLYVSALLLSLIWVGYSMYLSPVGLPSNNFHFLGYEELFLKMLPYSFISILLAITFAGYRKPPVKPKILALVSLIVLVALPASTLAAAKGLEAYARSQGKAQVVVGPDQYDLARTTETEGFITIRTTDGGNRWSHLQNDDKVNIVSEFTHQGSKYRVVIDKIMPRHPFGQYTTWSGVIYGADMHGGTGIGTNRMPKMTPEIAAWGYGKVYKDGKLISKMSAAHVMVSTKEPMKGIVLEVDQENKTLLNTPDGYLTIMWHNIDELKLPEDAKTERKIVGWATLLALNAGFLYLNRQPAPVLASDKPKRKTKK